MIANKLWAICHSKSKYLMLALFAFLLVSLFSCLCLSNTTFAIARQSSITVELSSSTISTNATPNKLATSNNQTISVSTNNYTGYTLSIEASNSNARNLSDGNGHSIETINTTISANEFSNNSNYNNKWGYKPSQYITNNNGTNTTVQNENYLPAPTTLGDTIDITSTANATNNSNSYNVAFGAKVDNTMPTGAYSGVFVYRTIANDIGYVIYYNENTEDQVDNMPDPNPEEATIAGGTTTSESYATLSNNTPTRTGFTFSGWCDVATTEDPTTHNQTCSGNTYNAGADYGIDQTMDNTNIELYAIWTKKTYTITLDQNEATTSGSTSTIATQGLTTLDPITLPQRSYTISGFTAGTNASGASVSSTATLTSNYTFNGWYKEAAATNKIANNSTTPALQANTDYTNSSSQWTNDGPVTLYAGWTAQAKTLPTITKTGYTCGWSTNQSATNYTYNSGGSLTPNTNYTLYGVCVIKDDLNLRVSFDSNVQSVEVKSGSATGTTIGTVTTSGDSVSGLTFGDDYYLVPTYDSGYGLDSWSKDSGTVGSLSSTTDAYPYYTIGDGTNGVTLSSKSSCQSTISGYMQDFKPCSDLPVNTTGTLTDSRDNQSYTVAKLADGKWWMTSNLNIAGGTALSVDDTDFVDTYTLPTSNNWTVVDGKLVLPASSPSASGTYFNTDNYAFVFNSSNTDCITRAPCYSYYSWKAATAGSGLNRNNIDAPYSICPKNWRLPNSKSTVSSNSDYYQLAVTYGMTSGSLSESTPNFYNQAGPNTVPNFYITDRPNNYLEGVYWSSTAAQGLLSYAFYFTDSYIETALDSSNRNGYAVRCVLRE